MYFKLCKQLRDLRHLALDLDGTLYLGGTLFPFTRPFLDTLERLRIGYTFVTNNSSRSTQQYLAYLNRLGINAEPSMIYSSTHATIEHIRRAYPDIRRLFVLGTEGMSQQLTEAGYRMSSAWPELVVVGFDTELRYNRLAQAAYWIKQGLPYLATHPDLVCPTDQPLVLPDCGAICRMLQAATGRTPDAVLGKPNVGVLSALLNRHGLRREQIAMVGDRLYTDIAMARDAGVMAVLVLSGETDAAALGESGITPDVVVQNVDQFRFMLEAASEAAQA